MEAGSVASPTDLDAYREQAEQFISELDQEYYLHYAGHKDTFELEPIYERHADLTKLESVQAIGRAVDGGTRVRELWRFACEGHLGELTREHAERLARLEADLKAEVDGEEIPFRMLRPRIANEADRSRRQRLDSARIELTEEHLNPVYVEAAEVTRATVPRLGEPTYLELYRRFGFRLDELADQCRALLEETERLWEEGADRLFRDRVGLSLEEAGRWDVGRVFRATAWDSAFPKEAMIPALESTLGGLGIDLREQENVELDVEERPLKTPRAFCVPIEIPDRVVLVIQPIGGPEDWHALFHEAGHAEHFAHARRDLAFEEKRLGDNAVTEGWAMLLEQLIEEPAWLERRLDVPRPDQFAREGATGLLYFVRRYAAKLLYELELHAESELQPMRARYVELLSAALKIEPSATDWLADVDSGFYASRTCAPGRSRRRSGSTCRPSSARAGSLGARLARSCASSGVKVSAGRRTSSCTRSPAAGWSSRRSSTASAARFARASRRGTPPRRPGRRSRSRSPCLRGSRKRCLRSPPAPRPAAPTSVGRR